MPVCPDRSHCLFARIDGDVCRDTNFCLDAQVHLPGYWPGYFPPVSKIRVTSGEYSSGKIPRENILGNIPRGIFPGEYSPGNIPGEFSRMSYSILFRHLRCQTKAHSTLCCQLLLCCQNVEPPNSLSGLVHPARPTQELPVVRRFCIFFEVQERNQKLPLWRI